MARDASLRGCQGGLLGELGFRRGQADLEFFGLAAPTFALGVSTWWPQVLAAITTGVTNAASEGINRAIKTDAVHLYANAL
ncbi:hypothetical protein [Streptomyces sp. NPDC002588]|uniref:hypothetical protein n=1 Tax=Streptomyces sp. NPDC002588 TaxID=3154419 RepID=UPI00331AFB06